MPPARPALASCAAVLLCSFDDEQKRLLVDLGCQDLWPSSWYPRLADQRLHDLAQARFALSRGQGGNSRARR